MLNATFERRATCVRRAEAPHRPVGVGERRRDGVASVNPKWTLMRRVIGPRLVSAWGARRRFRIVPTRSFGRDGLGLPPAFRALIATVDFLIRAPTKCATTVDATCIIIRVRAKRTARFRKTVLSRALLAGFWMSIDSRRAPRRRRRL
jgi:hypothetical protein